MEVSELYVRLEGDLAYVEDQLRACLASGDPRLEASSTHLLTAGGKRLRPVFVLLAGMCGQYDLPQLSKVAVGLELIHMATLVHDDVIDHADTRRGQATVKATYGNKMAMVSGDFIFARALEVLSEIEHVDVHRILSRAIWRMVAGEIEQIRDMYRLEQSMLQYLRRIRRKTALLIEMSCTLGAMVSGASKETVAALRRYGYCTGMAFQITDDILDFTASPEKLGKPVGGDLRQGNFTAPVLFALREQETKQALRSLISPTQSPAQVSEAIEWVAGSEGIAQSQHLADVYLTKAETALRRLPPGLSRDAFHSLAAFVGNRDH